MKLRTGQPWMTGAEYGRSLSGFGVNLLVRDVPASVAFHRTVLNAIVVYEDPDFAVLRHGAAEMMLHADHTYDRHPIRARLDGKRGNGLELRLHQADPDAAEAAARAGGYDVMAAAADKGHGLREVYIVDPDGYIWVPDRPTGA